MKVETCQREVEQSLIEAEFTFETFAFDFCLSRLLAGDFFYLDRQTHICDDLRKEPFSPSKIDTS